MHCPAERNRRRNQDVALSAYNSPVSVRRAPDDDEEEACAIRIISKTTGERTRPVAW
jgi:hypothetical protein